MHFTNSLVSALAISTASAAAVTVDHARNGTSIAALATKLHQKFITKDEMPSSQGVSTDAGLVSHSHKIGPRDVASADAIAATAVTDPDDWRYFHYEGIRTDNDHWWRGGGSRMYEIKAAHDQIVTPTLPKDIKIPKTLLPNNDIKVLALYVLAIDQYEAEEKKGMSEKMDNLVQKKKDVAKFNQMNQCVHDKNFCSILKFRETVFVSKYYKTFKRNYKKLFEKLKQEMLVAGLVELGRQVKQCIAETGLQVEIS